MLAAKKFYMIRHGETVANAAGYAAGHLDTPLTDRGRAQHVLDGLAVKPDYIVYSPLSRAADTAHILNRDLQLPMTANAKLMEQNYGDWQTAPWADIRPLMDQGQNPPNGETTPEFYQRAMAGITESLSLADGCPLIVTHGGVFDALWSYYQQHLIDAQNCHLYEFVTTDSEFLWQIISDPRQTVPV